jgi:hypothetical protein
LNLLNIDSIMLKSSPCDMPLTYGAGLKPITRTILSITFSVYYLFVFLMAVTMKNGFVRDMTGCILVEIYQCFRGCAAFPWLLV